MTSINKFFILLCVLGLSCAAQITIRGQTSVNVGDTLLLVCNGTDIQKHLSNFDWLKNEKTISPDNRISISISSKLFGLKRNVSSNLNISPVTKLDAGRYTCSISNELTDSVTVHVTGKSKSGAALLSSSTPDTLLLAAVVLFSFKY